TVEEFTPTQAPTITTNYLVQGTQNAAYLQTLTAMDGVGPYQWQVINGALPPGLTLAPNGVISGTPTQASTYFFTAKVQDSANGSSSKIFSININSDVTPTLLLNQNFSGQLY